MNFLHILRNASATNIAMRKVTVSLTDSVDLRIILSVLYIITEVIREEKVADSVEFKEVAETFTNELSMNLFLNYLFEENRQKIIYRFSFYFIHYKMHPSAMSYYQ